MYIPHLFFRFEVPKVSEEFSLRGKLSRLQEVKQAEEFLHRVLERSAGQQHLVFLGETTDSTFRIERERVGQTYESGRQKEIKHILRRGR